MTGKTRRFLVATAIAVLVVGIACGAIRSQDARHARFYDTGKSVNKFLSDYVDALKQGQKAGDASVLADYVSEQYRSPHRGQWRFVDRDSAADVKTSILTTVDVGDFGRPELVAEMVAYLGELESLDRLVMKIDMIEEIDPYRSVRLRVKSILDAVDRSGVAFQDRIFYRWYLENENEGGGTSWRIVRDELVEGLRVARGGRGFVELDPATVGIDYRHHRDPKLDIQGPDIRFGVIQRRARGAGRLRL